MTTVWYGDIVPTTAAWKVVASMLMFLWPILMTVLSSVTVVIFLESAKIVNISGKYTSCNSCNTHNDTDAQFCKRCGKKVKS
jgi:ribosomal protein L40E